MRIWHQSFTVLDDVPHYRDALAHHLGAQTEEGTTVDLHGLRPGTFPSVYPGTHMGHAYLTGLHKEQFVQAALRAQDEGYDAFFLATLLDTAYEELRTLIDIPVVALGHASVLMAAMLGERVGFVNFNAILEPHLRRSLRNYRLEDVVGPIVQVEAEFTDVMAAYAAPAPLVEAFQRAARRAAAEGATVIVAGRLTGGRRSGPGLARHLRADSRAARRSVPDSGALPVPGRPVWGTAAAPFAGCGPRSLWDSNRPEVTGPQGYRVMTPPLMSMVAPVM
jgi:allantoin racemase